MHDQVSEPMGHVEYVESLVSRPGAKRRSTVIVIFISVISNVLSLNLHLDLHRDRNRIGLSRGRKIYLGIPIAITQVCQAHDHP